MDSKRETADYKTDDETLQNIPPTKTLDKRQKVLWNSSSSDKEIFPTVLLNYKLNTQHKSLGAIPKRLESLKLKPFEEDYNIYNFRNLYHMSSDSLCDIKSEASFTLCKAPTSTAVMSTPLHCQSGNGSRHSIKVEIFNLPPDQQAQTEEHPFIHLTTSHVDGCKRPSKTSADPCNKCQRSKHGKVKCSTHSFKFDIFQLPIRQDFKPEDIPIKCSQNILQGSEVMVISGDGDDGKCLQLKSPKMGLKLHKINVERPKVNIELTKKHVKTKVHSKHTDEVEYIQADATNPDVIIAMAKSSKTPANLEGISTKVTRVETPTQTSESEQMQLLQVPSFFDLSTIPCNSISRTSNVAMAYRHRQLELHRLRVRVEKKRLELLEMKLNRERQQYQRDQMLLERNFEMKRWMCRDCTEEKDA